MPAELLLRFVIGGAIVSAFAVFGDVLLPKTFAGVFGAAPSVALATLGIAFVSHGAGYVTSEATGMLVGAIAMLGYGVVVAYLLMHRGNVLGGAIGSMTVWFAIALSGWALVLR